MYYLQNWPSLSGSNRRPTDLESAALPTELREGINSYINRKTTLRQTKSKTIRNTPITINATSTINPIGSLE